jgi:5-methylcytosine-specific restriction protein B
MLLDPAILDDIRRRHKTMVADDSLRSPASLDRYCATFAGRFGPPALRRMDGEELLEAMHNHSTRDSLVYWLEFKNDEEMPAVFGSIAGGSSLKFGIYRRKETGRWMRGSPTAQEELSIDAAVQIARKHRDQLVAAAEAIEHFQAAGEGDYAALQKALDRLAPDVGDTAWGHKYFSLLFPKVLDDYHVGEYQRFHLIKLLQLPPAISGRYVAAGQFATIARELDFPMNHLTAILNARHGRPHSYYRVGTGTDQARRSEWPGMREGGYTAVGWAGVGDLSDVTFTQASKEELRARMEKAYNKPPAVTGKATLQLFRFVAGFKAGDMVLAADGAQILGIGRITGDYRYTPGEDFPHRRNVEWLSTREWQLPVPEGLRTTVHEMRKDMRNLVQAEREILGVPAKPPLPPVVNGGGDAVPLPPLKDLTGVVARVATVLDRKGQVILYGPPGTGKTYWAERAARELAARSWYGKSYATLSEKERAGLAGAVAMCSFHAAFGYEDFLEGFRPIERAGVLLYERRDGLFKQLCDEARRRPQAGFYLIIDEINRGDIPRIFGELLTVLEKSRRGRPIKLAMSGDTFTVPDNVFLIGTMNTADRSIALLDAALRRRFGFLELMPDSSVLEDAVVEGIPLGPWLDALNERILKSVRRDARNLQVGHSYLMHGDRPLGDLARLAQVVRDDLIPLLEEYCYEDYEALEGILGTSLVLRHRRRIDEDLFRSGHEGELVRALLEPCRDLAASARAIASDAKATEVVAAEEEEEEEEEEDTAASEKT